MHADFLRCYFRCANVCFSTVLHVRRRKSLFIRRNCSLKPKFIEEGPGEKQKAFKLLRIAQNVLAVMVSFYQRDRNFVRTEGAERRHRKIDLDIESKRQTVQERTD